MEKKQHQKFRGTKCLNCEQPLDISDKYCYNCGQLNNTKKLNFDDFFGEFFSGLFAYDSRFHRTIRSLLFNPGKISKDYINGKRIRYANPFRFYLSVSIIFFLILGFANSFNNIGAIVDIEVPSQATLDTVSSGNNKQSLQDNLLSIEDKTIQTYRDIYVSKENLDSLSYLNSSITKFNIYSYFYSETRILNPEQAIDSLEYPPTQFNKWLYKKGIDWNIIKENPGLFVDYFINKLPFIIFFYLPLFTLFIWLLYAKHPFTYMEHLIFTFHVQTVFFILYALGILFNYLLDESWSFTLANIVFAFYLYKALRVFYSQSRVKTFVKFILLNFIFFTLAGIATAISVVASFAIY